MLLQVPLLTARSARLTGDGLNKITSYYKLGTGRMVQVATGDRSVNTIYYDGLQSLIPSKVVCRHLGRLIEYMSDGGFGSIKRVGGQEFHYPHVSMERVAQSYSK